MTKGGTGITRDQVTVDNQRDICAKYGAGFVSSPTHLKVGLARNFQPTAFPINGLRHPPEVDTTGWYIWSGESLSHDPGFFVPVHVEHMHLKAPLLMRYLGLRPGWRFLLAPGYADVWHDPSLLKI